ncbi:unnamed protein product [Ectocarpus fasciculatus]
MVHRNVKSPNVLLDFNGKAKLSDVNLAHISETINANTGGGYHTKVGSQYWMAPEVYTHKIVSAPSDVFSLHVVMWEVVTNNHNWVGPPIGELLLRAPDARLSLDGSSSGPAPLMRRMQRLLDRCGSALSRDRPTMKEITPEIAALCGHASATGNATTRRKIGTAAEQQPRLLPPYLFPVRPKVAPVSSTITASQEVLPNGHNRRRTTASCSSGESDDSASGGSAGRPGIALRTWLSKKPPPARFPPGGGGVDSAYSILATGGGGFQRQYATGMEGDESAAIAKSGLAGPAVIFGAARYVYGAETDASDCDTDAGSAFDGDGSEIEDSERDAAAVAGRGDSETARGDDDGQWKNVLLPDAAAEDMWGIRTQDSGNEAEGMCAHRETEAGAAAEQQQEQGEERGLEDGEVEEEIEEEQGEERKKLDGHKVLAPPPVAGLDQRGKHDRAVLMELFDRCRGPTWVGSTNWGSEEPLSTWHNVTVDRGGHVQKLTLPRNKISAGEIPSELGMLAFLRDLRLHRNSLRGDIPPFIGGLSSLTYLDLHGNNLRGRIPKEIGNLPLLESLILGQNKLSGPIPAEMGNLSRVRFISLQKNQLTGRIPRQLGKLAALQSLDLSFNALEGPIPTAFGDLRALMELTVGGNRLTGEIPPELGNLSKLVLLELYDNQLSGSVPEELENLTLLEHLAIAGNGLQAKHCS